jgi:hypothetical protein
MKRQSINVWKRINPGFVYSKPPVSVNHESHIQMEPESKDREFFHKRDSFGEYAEAKARFMLTVSSKKKE